MLYGVTSGHGRIMWNRVSWYVLVLTSVAHTAVCSAVMAAYGNTLQMGPICVIVTALHVMHVFSHCATSTGGVVISVQCIHRQMSEGARAQCYQE